MKLSGKTALITGTCANICGGMAEGLADEGAKIVCVDLNPNYTNQCAQFIAHRGGEAVGSVCHVTD